MPSNIEWTDETWNPITGCTKISAGCKNCYAERMARRLAGRYGYKPQPHHFDVTLHEDKLDKPIHWMKPRMIFVCSMGDLFHEDVPNVWIDDIINIASVANQHTYMILTKRPKRMHEYFSFNEIPENVWAGVTTEHQQAYFSRVAWLKDIKASVKFVSMEPLLGKIYADLSGIDWVIVGGETGPGARPMDADWARQIRDDCIETGTPFFFKKMGSKRQTPEDLMIRQWPN